MTGVQFKNSNKFESFLQNLTSLFYNLLTMRDQEKVLRVFQNQLINGKEINWF